MEQRESSDEEVTMVGDEAEESDQEDARAGRYAEEQSQMPSLSMLREMARQLGGE